MTDAGTAAAAAKAGVAAIVAPTAEEAAEKAAHIVGLLPANNLTGPAIFEFEQPTAALAAGAEPAKAAAAVVDKDSAVELYAGFGKSVYTAFATVGGNAWALWPPARPCATTAWPRLPALCVCAMPSACR